ARLQRNPTDLAAIRSGVLDLRLTPQGLTEQRYFQTAASGRAANAASGGPALKGAQAAALLKFAPPDAQLAEIRARSNAEELAGSVANALFGSLPVTEPPRPEAPEHHSSSSDDD